jgi:hypothetical protein
VLLPASPTATPKGSSQSERGKLWGGQERRSKMKVSWVGRSGLLAFFVALERVLKILTTGQFFITNGTNGQMAQILSKLTENHW